MSALGDYVHLHAINYEQYGTLRKNKEGQSNSYANEYNYTNWIKKRTLGMKPVSEASLNILRARLKNNTSQEMSQEEKELAKAIVPYYIDEYQATMNDSTVTTKTRLINAIGKYLVNSVQNQYSLSDEVANTIKDLVINSINDYDKKVSGITDANKKTLIAKQTATELTFEIIPLVTDESLKEQTTYLINDLKSRYEERKGKLKRI